MSEVNPVVWAVIAYVSGALLRVFWPYVLAYLQEGAKFDVRYVIGQAVTALIGLIPILAAQEFLEQLSALGWLAAFGMGFGFAAIGREAQKSVGMAGRKATPQ